MWKALVFKELRELAPIAALALCAYGVIVARLTGVEIIFFWRRNVYNDEGIPFVSDGFTTQMLFISVCFTIGLAVKQTLGESWRGTWLWLWHRPVSRTPMMFVKMTTGAAVYLLVAALPIAWYSCWAAMPRKHPSPFFWSMTAEAWASWGLTLTVYLAAFWSGMWPARSIGPRWMPLIGMGAMVLIGSLLLSPISSIAVAACALVLAALAISNILSVSRTRDFS